MSGYSKLHSSILHSTVWREPHHVRVVWVTMMAMADAHGEVCAGLPGLADVARVTLEECAQAIECFTSPDPYSRDPEHEGRRVEPIPGGWRLLNYAKHRNRHSLEERRRYEAERKRLQRQRKTSCPGHVPDSPGHVPEVPDCPAMSRKAEAEAEAEATKNPPIPPNGGGPSRLPPKRRRRRSDDDESDLPPGLVDQVLELMREAVRDVTKGRDRGPQNTPGNRELVRSCTRREKASLDDWKRVISAQQESARHNPSSRRYLVLSTITVRKNWLRLLDAPRGPQLRQGGQVDPATETYEERPF